MNALLKTGLLGVAVSLCLGTVEAQERSFSKYCNLDGYPSAARETQIVIDTTLITPETDKPLEENLYWRKRVTSLLNAAEPGTLKRWAPRERVTVSMVDGDTGGLRTVFEGCIPIYSPSEEIELDSNQSRITVFTTGGWKRSLEKDQDAFRRSLAFALVVGARETSPGGRGDSFPESGLGQALARGYNPSLQYGTPRLIVLTDSDSFTFPEGEAETVRARAREDGMKWGADLSRSEVHILGATQDMTSAEKDYLRRLLLMAKGDILTVTSLNGSLNATSAPVSVQTFRGSIVYPDGRYPMTMRLAVDEDQRAVNSWVEVQSDQVRFAPLEGVLVCNGDSSCEFTDTGDFAQLWSNSPGGDPEFENWMPFVGFRDIKFEIDGDVLTGAISDSSGFVEGMENGLEFELERIERGGF